MELTVYTVYWPLVIRHLFFTCLVLPVTVPTPEPTENLEPGECRYIIGLSLLQWVHYLIDPK